MYNSEKYTTAKDNIKAKLNDTLISRDIINKNTAEVIQFIIDMENEIRHLSNAYHYLEVHDNILKYLDSMFDNYDKHKVSKFLIKVGFPDRKKCNNVSQLCYLISYIPVVMLLWVNTNGFQFIASFLMSLILSVIYIDILDNILFESRFFYFKKSRKYLHLTPPKNGFDL